VGRDQKAPTVTLLIEVYQGRARLPGTATTHGEQHYWIPKDPERNAGTQKPGAEVVDKKR
jgi:hypothetical protein